MSTKHICNATLRNSLSRLLIPQHMALAHLFARSSRRIRVTTLGANSRRKKMTYSQTLMMSRVADLGQDQSNNNFFKMLRHQRLSF